MGPAGAGLPGAEKGLFVRNATGLVRRISVVDAFNINMGAVNVGGGWVSLTFILAIFTNADLAISFLLGAVSAVLLGLVYVQLVSAMPRSGGDYVFISRLINPVVGAGVGGALLVLFSIFPGFWATNFATLHLQGLLNTIAQVSGNTGFSSLAASLSHQVPQVIIALLFIAALAAIALWHTGIATRVLALAFILQLVALLVGMGVYLFSSHAHFVQAFNATYGPKNSYDGIIALASHNGYAVGFSLGASFSALPYAALNIWGFSWSAYPAGELRNAAKSILYSQFAAITVAVVLYIAIWELAKNTLGESFLNAVNYMATNYPAKYPLANQPSLSFYATLLTSNGLVKIIISCIPIFAELALVMAYVLTTSRVIFALSFDRVLPEGLTRLSERRATPASAIVLTAVGIGIVAIVAITTSFLAVWSNGTLGLAIVYALVSLSAALLPYVRPDLYASSPKTLAGTIAGVPLITIVGALSMLFSLYIVYLAFAQPLVVGPISWQSVTATIITFLWGVVAYAISRTYHRSRGLNPSLAMTEIPPE